MWSVLSMDVKIPGDLIYVLGETRDEMGGSEYYDLLGSSRPEGSTFKGAISKKTLSGLAKAIQEGLVSSAHGVYRGGLASTWLDGLGR